jgi:hypothetical protein
MVIFDNSNTYNGQVKGLLYLNFMDVDYLLTKYGEDELKKRLPHDYVDHFLIEQSRRDGLDKLDVQYYPILYVAIQTDEDEELLRLIKEEVKEGNLYTKSYLTGITVDTLDNEIRRLHAKKDKLNNEELYALRSYMLSKYVNDNIDKANEYTKEAQECGGFVHYYEFNQITEDLKKVGASSEIKESDYFSITRE